MFFLILLISLLKISLFLFNSSMSISLFLVDYVALVINVVSFLFAFFRLINWFPSSDVPKSCPSIIVSLIEASITDKELRAIISFEVSVSINSFR